MRWPRIHFFREDHYRRNLRSVALAAHLLRISEYEVFKEAYQQWHQYTPSDPELEKRFVRYLFSGELPNWVQAYIGDILEQAYRGNPQLIPVSERLFALPNVAHSVWISWRLNRGVGSNSRPTNTLYA